MKKMITAVITAIAAAVTATGTAMAAYTQYDAQYNSDGSLKSVDITQNATPYKVDNTSLSKTFFWDENMKPYDGTIIIDSNDIAEMNTDAIFTNDKKYKLSRECQALINGYNVSPEIFASYIFDCNSVKLSDFDNNGSYDEISVDLFFTMRVDGIETNEFYTNLYVSSYGDYIIKLDMSNNTIHKDGEKISADKIQKGDYLSVPCDVNQDIMSQDFYDISVVTKNEDITVTEINYNDHIVYSGSNSYRYRDYLTEFELSCDYRVWLDNDGVIIGCKNTDEYKYGIIISCDTENKSVKLVNEDAEVKDYTCTEGVIYRLKSEISESINWSDSRSAAERVYRYAIKDGKIALIDKAYAAAYDGAFNKYTSMFGSVVLDNETKILDIEGFADVEKANTVSISDFVDGMYYPAVAFDVDDDDDTAAFMVVLSGLRIVNDNTPFAVVSSMPKMTSHDGYVYYDMDVVSDGVKKTLSIPESDYLDDIVRGSVIVYREYNNKIYDLKIVNKAVPDYRQMTSNAVNSSSLNSLINDANWCNNSYNGCRTYFGIITSTGKNIFDLITRLSNGTADLYDSDLISINGNTHITYYDYLMQDLDNTRVYTAETMPTVQKDMFISYASWDDTDVVSFKDAVDDGAEVHFALVKEVDGVAKDIVVYIR